MFYDWRIYVVLKTLLEFVYYELYSAFSVEIYKVCPVILIDVDIARSPIYAYERPLGLDVFARPCPSGSIMFVFVVFIVFASEPEYDA